MVGVSSAYSFIHGDGGGQGFAVIRDVVRRDGVFFRRCKQEDEGVFASYSDIGFIPSGFIIDRTFEAHVELVAVIGCGFGVVEDGLV